MSGGHSDRRLEVTHETGWFGMQTAVILLLIAAAPCVGTAQSTQRQGPGASGAFTGATRWQPWRRPADTPLSAAQAELRVDLIRHVEMSVLFPPTGFGSGEVLATFPLAGDLLDGRPFWASSVRLESGMYGIVVYERSGRGWREVARRRSRSHYYTAAVPVRIEPANAWIVAKGAVGRVPTWEVLRFDGESVHEELVGNWADIMLFDVDLDGIFEILGEDICYRWCEGERARSVGLYRWNGAEMTQVRLEALSAGSASDATVVVAANNRAVELAGAERWAEALAVVDGTRARVTESAVFGRNAGLIDLNAPVPDGYPWRWERFTDYVFAGLWAEAVDLFRHKPILPDFFATFPPYIDEYMDLLPSVRAAFDVTTAARTVAPALPEIEFLHGWAAYHLRAWADPSMESLLPPRMGVGWWLILPGSR